MPQSIPQIAATLVSSIREYQSVAVAFSGGVDSAVVAKACVLALQDRAVAVTAVSPSLPAAELADAIRLSQRIGIRHVQVSTNEFERPAYRANAADRCFYCKETLYSLLKSRQDELQVRWIVNGTNLDDLGDHRPGLDAARQYDVRSPLVEQQIDKATVRALAAFWNLEVADKPASPCLSSRIAYGVEVTEERVARIERAEELIRRLTGLRELRVRTEAGDLARIEVPVHALPLLTEDSRRELIVSQLRELGFRRVTLDLEGFRSGSMNEGLSLVELKVGTPSIPA